MSAFTDFKTNKYHDKTERNKSDSEKSAKIEKKIRKSRKLTGIFQNKSVVTCE